MMNLHTLIDKELDRLHDMLGRCSTIDESNWACNQIAKLVSVMATELVYPSTNGSGDEE
jgi:hypothetical protein